MQSRHESIDTTMRYYVGQNARNTARTLWAAHKKATSGNHSDNTRLNRPESAVRVGDASSCAEKTCEVGPEGFEPPTKGL